MILCHLSTLVRMPSRSLRKSSLTIKVIMIRTLVVVVVVVVVVIEMVI